MYPSITQGYSQYSQILNSNSNYFARFNSPNVPISVVPSAISQNNTPYTHQYQTQQINSEKQHSNTLQFPKNLNAPQLTDTQLQINSNMPQQTDPDVPHQLNSNLNN